MLFADNLESFKIPEALIEFLSRASQSSPVDKEIATSSQAQSAKHVNPLTKAEALNALIQCFASGRRIAEG
jgi:hypothetical protein